MSFPRYPAYKDSGVEWLGDVPAHWEVVRLRRIAQLQSGAGLQSECIQAGGEYPVFGGNGLRGFTDSFTHEGDFVLIGRQGALCGNVNIAHSKFWATEHALVVHPLRTFNVYWMGAVLDAATLSRLSMTAAQPGLAADVVGRVGIPLPPLPEQTAIVEYLDRETAELDALVADQERLIALLKEKRQAVISHAVTRGLNPDAPRKDSGVEWLGEVPAHWEVVRLKHAIREPLMYGANESSEINNPEFPRFIRITDIDETGQLRADTFSSIPDEVAAPYMLAESDILLARSGATAGKAIRYRQAWGRAAFAGYLIRARLDTDTLTAGQCIYYLNSSQYLDWVKSITIQATIQNISAEKYASLPIPLPPLPEQHAIVEYLDRETAKLDGLVAEAEHAIALLRERRSALISAAVTGHIDVRARAT